MLGKRDPDVRGNGLPVKKGQYFMANFDLRPAGLRCRDGVVSPKRGEQLHPPPARAGRPTVGSLGCWALCCCLLIIAALLRKRGGTLRELRLAQPARTPTKFLVLMMKGRVGSVWLRGRRAGAPPSRRRGPMAPASAATSTGATRREVRL